MLQNRVTAESLLSNMVRLAILCRRLTLLQAFVLAIPQAHIAFMTSPGFLSLAKMMPWFDEVIADPRAGLLNLAAAWRIRQYFRQDWSVIVDMQCSSRTRNYFAHFVPSNTRWIGNASGCSDPLPDFTGVNNRDRMVTSAKMAGGVSQSPICHGLSMGRRKLTIRRL
jgi:hypothetical protein